MSHLCPDGAQGQGCEKDPRAWGEMGRVGALEAKGGGGHGVSPLPAVEWQLQIPGLSVDARPVSFLAQRILSHVNGFGADGYLWVLLEQDELGSERCEGALRATCASPPVKWTKSKSLSSWACV